MPSSYIAPAPHPPPIPTADSRSNAVLVSVPREPAHRRVDSRRSAKSRTCDRTRGSPLSTRTLAHRRTARLGCCGPRDTAESRIAPSIHRVVRRQNPLVSRRRRVVPHAVQSPEKSLGVLRSCRGSAAKKPRKFAARTSPIRSPTTRSFAKDLLRFSAASSSKAPSAPNCAR